MKKMMLLGFLMLAAVALAGESTYTLTSSTQATAPSGASQTGAIAIANTWKGVGVAIFDQRDGGAGDVELIQSQVRGRAWLYNAAYANPDGGGGWLRYPALDAVGVSDAGAGGVAGQFVEVAPAVAGGLSGDKLYSTTENVLLEDGGTPVHKVTITTLY